jgi:hypothetical protein
MACREHISRSPICAARLMIGDESAPAQIGGSARGYYEPLTTPDTQNPRALWRPAQSP